MGDDTNYDALFAPNNFFVFNLEDALPILQTTLIQYMGIFPIKGGKRPQTDGKRIFLPSSIDDFQDPKSDLHKNKNMSLYLSHLIHEMLHIREGSFFVDSRPFLEKFKNPSLAHRVFNIIEDARIEFNAREYLQPDHARIMLSSNNYLATDHNLRTGDAQSDSADNKSLEGTGEDLIQLYSTRLICKGMPSAIMRTAHTEEDVVRRRLALQVTNQANPSKLLTNKLKLSTERATALLEKRAKAVLAEKHVLAVEVENADLRAQGLTTLEDVLGKALSLSEDAYHHGVEKTWELVPEVYELFVQAVPDVEKNFPSSGSKYIAVNAPCAKGDGKPGEGKGQNPGEGQKAYVGGIRGDVHDFSAGEKADIKEIVEAAKAAKAAKEAKAAQAKNDDKKDNPNKDDGNVDVGCGDGKVKISGHVKIKTYNDLTQSYKDIATLVNTTYSGTNPNFLADLVRYDLLIDEIIGHFEELKPNQLQRKPRSSIPDRLNMQAVIDVIADPNLRRDARIFDSYHIHKRDYAWGILVDISGSTGGILKNGQRIIDVERGTMGLLYRALTDLGDIVYPMAFSTSNGGTNLYHLDSLENIGALEPEDWNADGVAIRGAAYLMSKVSAKEKRLIVITDGNPVGSGSEGFDPVVDTAQAFAEAESLGIKTAYFNVQDTEAEYFAKLTQFCGFAKRLSGVTNLPQAVGQYVLDGVA